MFGQMFMFEWRYFTRQPSFFVTCLIFFLLTFFATISENVQIGGGGNVVYNGPLRNRANTVGNGNICNVHVSEFYCQYCVTK